MPSKPERCISWTEHTAFPAPSSRVSAWRTQLEDRGKNQIFPSKVNRYTLRTLQTPFVKNKNDDKERNAYPERSGRERNLKRRAR